MKFEKLGNIARIQIGKTPPRGISKYWGKGNSWVSISDMKSSTISSTKEEITDLAVSECGCKMIPKDTLLMSFKLSIGKVAFAGKDLFTNEAICGIILKDKSKVASEYLYYALKNTKLVGSNVAVKGATLNTASLNALQIPLIEGIENQLRIANLLSKAENLIAQRKESIRLLDEFLKSTFLEMFLDKDKRKNWEFTELKNTVEKAKHSIKAGPFGSSLKKEFYVPFGYKIYGQEQVIKDDLNYGDYYINEELYKKLESCKIKEGDVLISLVGTYGKISVVPKDFEAGIINPRLMKISFDKEKINTTFFKHFFKSEFLHHQLKKFSHGNTMDIINVGIVKELIIPVPPITLQTQFAQIVEKTEALKTQYQKSLQELENLYGSLSQKAFRGELSINKAISV